MTAVYKTQTNRHISDTLYGLHHIYTHTRGITLHSRALIGFDGRGNVSRQTSSRYRGLINE